MAGWTKNDSTLIGMKAAKKIRDFLCGEEDYDNWYEGTIREVWFVDIIAKELNEYFGIKDEPGEGSENS